MKSEQDAKQEDNNRSSHMYVIHNFPIGLCRFDVKQSQKPTRPLSTISISIHSVERAQSIIGDTFLVQMQSSVASVMPSNAPSQLSLRRNTSAGTLIADRAESKVLVIYTGGTIGMMRNETGGKRPRQMQIDYIIAISVPLDRYRYRVHAFWNQLMLMNVFLKCIERILIKIVFA